VVDVEAITSTEFYAATPCVHAPECAAAAWLRQKRFIDHDFAPAYFPALPRIESLKLSANAMGIDAIHAAAPNMLVPISSGRIAPPL
jgi:hypothetical protein